MERKSLEERRKEAEFALLERQDLRNKKGMVTLSQSKYLDDPALKEFNKKIREEGFKKARRSIKLGTVDETNNEIQAYFNLCDDFAQLPSIKSLCLYLGISVSTYNSYLRDIDSEYGELFRAAIDYIHSVIEGGAMNNKVNPATYMFTASNFYGMKDSRQIDISAVAPNQNTSMSSRDSLNALREELEREKKGTTPDNAKETSFVEKEIDINE